MADDKVNGPEDSVVTGMTNQLPQEQMIEITTCFAARIVGQDAEPKKGNRSYRAIALASVMSKWYATNIILRPEKEKTTVEWK